MLVTQWAALNQRPPAVVSLIQQAGHPGVWPVLTSVEFTSTVPLTVLLLSSTFSVSFKKNRGYMCSLPPPTPLFPSPKNAHLSYQTARESEFQEGNQGTNSDHCSHVSPVTFILPYITPSVLPPGGGYKQERKGQAETTCSEHSGDAACGQLSSGYV